VSATRSLSTRLAEHRSDSAACRVARTPEELDLHFHVRRAVFVDEQGIFAGHDRDEHDDDPATLHAIGSAGDQVAGAVRLYPLDDAGLWQGDRLAVLAPVRHGFLGAELVRFAVATAGELGGHTMHAMIQLPNVRFFELLGWSRNGDVEPYHGVEHQPMSIPLGGRSLSRRAL
jgi:putative N-acetyltransferase (TIGR04045 family)